jgi:tripartite-type tricarboxylate transporter receptor subunit TctC
LPDYNISFSFGLYAPMKTPPDDVKKIFEAAVKVLKRPDIREKLATQGMDPLPNNSPNEFRLQNQREAPMWSKLIEASGAKVD